MKLLLKANLRLEGSKERLEGIALVDNGASVTVIDKDIADKVGITYVKRTLIITTASGHKMKGELGVVNKLTIEEELPYAHLLLWGKGHWQIPS